MSESTSNPFWRFLVGVGRFINFANHLVFNLIMLVVVFLIVGVFAIAIAAKSGAGGIHPIQDKTALVLDLEGTLVNINEEIKKLPRSRLHFYKVKIKLFAIGQCWGYVHKAPKC